MALNENHSILYFCANLNKVLAKNTYLYSVNVKNMNDEKKNNFKKRMQALHEKYTQQLPEKYQEIEDSWNSYQADSNNLDLIEIFYRLIHTLKGTAATFGFSTQADICFEIQKILLDGNDKPSVLSENSVQQIHEHLNKLKNNISAPAENISG